MMMTNDEVRLPCGCVKTRRRAKLLKWLLGKRWIWLFDWFHGPVTIEEV